jgi:succinoglycan biosynthesis protein ExoL
MSKILFIVQQLSQPRCIKRIETIVDEGFNYKVYGFNNGLYEDNIKNLKYEIEEIREINKDYSKPRKIIEYIRFVSKVIKEAEPEDIIYTFGFELGLINSLMRPRNYIYEEADILAARINNKLFRKILIKLDVRIIKKSNLTVLTSEGFIKYLFKNNCPYLSKIILLQNKLHKSFLTKVRPVIKPINLNCINFGFVGLIRYPNTILRFAQVVGEQFPQHKFHFFGDIEGNCVKPKDWLHFDNIIFHGRFKNPVDLERIYESIDINIACYDTSSGNVKIAEPNKLYESIFFFKPIVVSRFTFLEKRVKELNSGFSIDASKDNEISKFISNLNYHQISDMVNSMKAIKNESLINSSNKLIRELEKLYL